jgi:acyl-CoA synthetase (AMP-forming)/AMP-acid ligase II
VTSIDALFRAAVRERADAIAVAGAYGERTFAELDAAVGALASGLRDSGIGPGDRVAVWLPNGVEWMISALATARLDAVLVSLNPRYRAAELQFALGHSRARVVIASPVYRTVDCWAILAAALGALDPPAPPLLIATGADVPAGATSFEALIGRAGTGSLTPPRAGGGAPADIAVLMYTSGSTSAPKAVIRTAANLIPHAVALTTWWRLGSHDRISQLFPLCGTTGLMLWLATLAARGTAVLHADGETGGQLAGRLRDERVTFLGISDFSLHPLLDDLARSGPPPAVRAGFIAVFGTGNAGEIFAAAEAALPARFVNPYGLTEANAFCLMGALDDPLERRCQVGGRAVGSLEFRLGAGDELLLRGPSVFPGYLDAAPQTDSGVDADGWLHTGDLARVQDGAAYFLGRIKDVLKVRGFVFSPREVEAVLFTVPGVADAQVVGVPGPEGDVVVAYAVRDGSGRVEPDDLITACRRRISPYKVPARVEFLESMPRIDGPTGPKVDRTLLKTMATKNQR